MVKTTAYKQTEVGLIPSDWEVVSVGACFEFKNGLNKAKEFFGQGTPIVNYMDVYKNSGIYATDLTGKVTLSKDEIRNYEVKKGDVFFTRTSETVDEIGVSTVALDEMPDTVFSGFVLRGRPKSNRIVLNYKKYCFSISSVRRQIISTASYTTRALTNGRALSNIKLALPKEDTEQTAIATALSDMDDLINSLSTLIEKKKAIKQGAMQQLLKPKEGWEVKKLGEVCDFASGTAHENFIDERGDYVVVNSKFISTNGEVQKFANTLFCPAKKDDILIVLSDVPNGKAIAKCFLVEKDNCFTVNQRIGIVKPFQNINSKFLYYLINRHPYLLAFDDGAKQTNLRNQDVTGLPISVPIKEEQQRIASILSEMNFEIQSLEQNLSKYQMLKQGMMQELLTGKTRLV